MRAPWPRNSKQSPFSAMISFSDEIKSTQTVVGANKYADTSTLGSIDVLRSHRVDMCGPGEPSGEPDRPPGSDRGRQIRVFGGQGAVVPSMGALDLQLYRCGLKSCRIDQEINLQQVLIQMRPVGAPRCPLGPRAAHVQDGPHSVF